MYPRIRDDEEGTRTDVKAFSAFHLGGPQDGGLALFEQGFTARDFTFIAIDRKQEDGALFVVFDYQWKDDPPVRYTTEYAPMIRAARRLLVGVPRRDNLPQSVSESFMPCEGCGRVVRHSMFSGQPWQHYGCDRDTLMGLR